MSEGGNPKPAEASQRPKIEDLEQKLEAAHFSGTGDKEKVMEMLKDYNALLAFGRRRDGMKRAKSAKVLPMDKKTGRH